MLRDSEQLDTHYGCIQFDSGTVMKTHHVTHFAHHVEHFFTKVAHIYTLSSSEQLGRASAL